MKKARLFLTLALFILASVFVQPAHADYTYTSLDVPGAAHTYAHGISGNNIVGFYTGSGQHGFLFDGTNFTTLDVAGAAHTYAYGISGNNIVGSYDYSGLNHGFVYNGTNYTTLDVPGAANTYAYGISGNNIVGTYDYSGFNHGFVYNGTNYTILDVPGAAHTCAYGISGNNIVGIYVDGSGQHGFLYNGTSYTTLDVPGAVRTYLYGISGNNIVGMYLDSSGQHGFHYNGTSFTSLDVPGAGWTDAYGISGNSIVGYYFDGIWTCHGFTVTAPEVNRPPVLSPIGDKTVQEGQILTFTVSATDPDGNALTYSASNLPTGATFYPTTGTFTWIPGYDQTGVYANVLFTVTDNGTPLMSSSEAITISVDNANQPILTGKGIAMVDGIMSPGEWDGAGRVDLVVNTPGGGTTPATLYIMNDNLNLYLAVHFARQIIDPGNSLSFGFDNNDNGVAENGDESFGLGYGIDGPRFIDGFRTDIPPCTPDAGPAGCGFSDIDYGGTNDGQGAFRNDGTFSVYEMSHPLSSGDVGHDFALSAGQTVGFYLQLRMIGTGGQWPQDYGDTYFPGLRNFGHILIQPFVPPASIYPTSANHANCGNTGSKIRVLPAEESWTATSNDPWINITADNTGTGLGYVTYSVEPNSGSDRIGTMTIAGQTFTVDQKSALPCIPAPVLVSPPNGATSVPANITLAWNPPLGAESYEMWVTTDPAFNSHVIQAETYDVFFDVPPNVLMPGTLYYWGVMAHNGTYATQSNWSSVWSFTTTLSVTLTFGNVSIPAQVNTSSSGPTPPSGFRLGSAPTYYNISTTVNYTPPVTVCIGYDPAPYTDPSSLRLLHYESDTWLDVTASNYVTSHRICGQVNSLSPFLVAQRMDQPPVITVVSANPAVLWPPNSKMVDVTLNYSATDDWGQPACLISTVTGNEQISSADYAIADAHHVKLRAERSGGVKGRIYTIAISCTDTSGNSSNQTVQVSVPHDQGKK